MIDIPFIDIHTHRVKTFQAYTVLNVFAGDPVPVEYPSGIYFSVGIHPWHLGDWQNKFLALRTSCLYERVIAIGECGLDKNTAAPMNLQEEVFRSQIALSESLRKPLIVHCVKAFDELIQIKRELNPRMPWIIHGFNKNPELGKQCLEHGLLLSFGKILFADHKILTLIKTLRRDQFFLETEDSQTEIGKVFARCAEIKNCSLEDLRNDIFWHFCKVFGIYGDKEPQP